VLLIDIYDRKRAKYRIRQHEMELRQITDAIPQAIAVLAPDGTTLYTNRAALDWAASRSKRLGLTAFSRGPSIPMMRKGCEPSVAGLLRGVSFELAMGALRKGGQYRWRLIQYNPLRDEQGLRDCRRLIPACLSQEKPVRARS
jgi:formate hydrogenlyase transcriptional activator